MCQLKREQSTQQKHNLRAVKFSITFRARVAADTCRIKLVHAVLRKVGYSPRSLKSVTGREDPDPQQMIYLQ